MKMDEKISLRPIDINNYRDILKLKVRPDQEQFVASNAVSLAQASFHTEAWTRGIYAGQLAVGFVMLEIDEVKPDFYLWRFMIDADQQGKGYGRKAMEAIIEVVKDFPAASEFTLSYVPQAGNPMPFYAKLGFEETGEMEEGECIMRLEF